MELIQIKRLLLIAIFLSASSSWATIFHHEILDHLKLVGLAKIAAHIYDGDEKVSLHPDVKLVSEVYVGSIRIGYCKYSLHGCDHYILAVRGSDNADNYVEDAQRFQVGVFGFLGGVGFVSGDMRLFNQQAFVEALDSFEGAHGQYSL